MISLLWSTRHPTPLRWAFVLCLGLLTGCGRDNIEVYRIAKEQAPQTRSGMPAGHPDTAGPASGGMPRLKYTLPAGWQESAPGEMRVASFRVLANGKQADVAVVPLPGLMGKDLENVNRWRSTIGLEPIKEEDLPKITEAVSIAGAPGQLYDLAGENPGSGEKMRILAAVLRREGVAWFFKMSGDDDLVKEQKPAFVTFLKGVSFEAAMAPVGSGETASEPVGLPPSHPPIGDASMMQTSAASGGGQDKPDWQVPANWKEANAGGFLVAKYVVNGADNSRADVNVSMSPGAGGGVAGNVNRWRGQLGLGELPEAELNQILAPLETAAGKAVSVDMTGTDARSGQKARLVGVIIPLASQTWFYKIMGNEQVVAAEKDAFLKFVQTAKPRG